MFRGLCNDQLPNFRISIHLPPDGPKRLGGFGRLIPGSSPGMGGPGFRAQPLVADFYRICAGDRPRALLRENSILRSSAVSCSAGSVGSSRVSLTARPPLEIVGLRPLFHDGAPMLFMRPTFPARPLWPLPDSSDPRSMRGKLC